MSHRDERQQNRRDDETLGVRVEEWVFNQTHEERINTPPWWKFWASPTAETVVIRQVPMAQRLLNQFIEQLPPDRSRLAREPELNARLLKRVTTERARALSANS